MNARTPLLVSALLAATLFAAGCVTVRPVTNQRVDQEITGNQGYLFGESDAHRIQDRKETKTFIKIDIDLSRPDAEADILQDYPQESRKPTEPVKRSTERPGDFERGYFEPRIEKKYAPIHEIAEEITRTEIKETKEIKILPVEAVYDYYTVKKGETLWDIAGRPEVYGKSSKWQVIFEANRDQIKKPNLIRPGMKLKIPR